MVLGRIWFFLQGAPRGPKYVYSAALDVANLITPPARPATASQSVVTYLQCPHFQGARQCMPGNDMRQRARHFPDFVSRRTTKATSVMPTVASAIKDDSIALRPHLLT